MSEYKYQEVYQRIIHDIENGFLQYHEKIPSVRQMAKSMHISRTTVENAYQQLVAEGYIYPKEKSGYFVATKTSVKVRPKVLLDAPLSTTSQQYQYDFSGRFVDTESFHFDIWKKYIKRALQQSEELMSYGETLGEPQLRSALQTYSMNVRGVRRPVHNYVVGAGFQSLLYHICGLFPQDTVVAMEESGFKQAEIVFENCHMKVDKLPIDKQGISVEYLRDSKAKVLYLNSSSGYHGLPLKRQRRNEILSYAKEKEIIIIEDDHNGELKFNTKPIDAMARDDDQYIIYIGSFSKLLLPSLRISYMALPSSLMQKYLQKFQFVHQTTSKLEQIALAMYIEDGQLTRHLKRLRKHYTRKSKLLWEMLHFYFPTNNIQLYETSLKITMELRDVSIDEFINHAKQKSVLVNKQSTHQIALSFSGILEKDIPNAIEQLQQAYVEIKKKQ